MLPRAHRLLRRQDFDAVYRRGRVRRGRLLTIRSLQQAEGPIRVGFVVGTAVSKRATIRNRIKRQLRHVSLALLPNLPPHLDVVLTYHDGPAPEPAALKTAVENALSTLRE